MENMENMENNQNVQNTNPTAATSQQNPPASIDVEAIAAMLEARQERAGRSALKSYAEQAGLSVEQVTAAVDDYKAKQASAIPPDVQARIDAQMKAANDRLLAAEVRTVGAELHIVDFDAALRLMDKSAVAIGEDGTVSGVREALDALTQSRPWLVASPAPAPSGTGSTGNFPRGASSEQADYAARLLEARQSGNQTLAVSIIREAAAKGIALR